MPRPYAYVPVNTGAQHADREDARRPAGDLPPLLERDRCEERCRGERPRRPPGRCCRRAQPAGTRAGCRRRTGSGRVYQRLSQTRTPSRTSRSRYRWAGASPAGRAENDQRHRDERGDRAGADDLAPGEGRRAESESASPTAISTTVPAKPDMRARVGSLSKAAVLVATALALLAGEARAETQAFRVRGRPRPRARRPRSAPAASGRRAARTGCRPAGQRGRPPSQGSSAEWSGTPFGAGFPPDRC